jgi:hypothetical protein
VDWSAVEWLRSVTRMPMLIIGVATPDDPRLALEHGAAGIIVSNHGGRQLDGAEPTIHGYRRRTGRPVQRRRGSPHTLPRAPSPDSPTAIPRTSFEDPVRQPSCTPTVDRLRGYQLLDRGSALGPEGLEGLEGPVRCRPLRMGIGGVLLRRDPLQELDHPEAISLVPGHAYTKHAEDGTTTEEQRLQAFYDPGNPGTAMSIPDPARSMEGLTHRDLDLVAVRGEADMDEFIEERLDSFVAVVLRPSSEHLGRHRARRALIRARDRHVIRCMDLLEAGDGSLNVRVLGTETQGHEGAQRNPEAVRCERRPERVVVADHVIILRAGYGQTPKVWGLYRFFGPVASSVRYTQTSSHHPLSRT